MQHIIATQQSPTTLCGIDRDNVRQSGPDMCPECKVVDTRIQECIKILQEGKKSKELLNFLDKLNSTTSVVAEDKKERKLVDYKASAIKSLKRGAAAGTMKVLSKRIKAKLTEKFPQLALVPENIWNVLLCLAINMTANAAPELPGIKVAEQLSAEAFEGLLTDATSRMVQDVIETVSETVMEITEKKPGLLGE